MYFYRNILIQYFTMNISRPDNVVFNEDNERYDASLKPYGTNVGAPTIQVTNAALWKNTHIQKVNHQFSTIYEELKASYEAMMQQFEYNNMIYNAKFNFEPIVGETYHLYKDKNEHPFLSLIPPQECNFNFLDSFRLNAEMIWERITTQ